MTSKVSPRSLTSSAPASRTAVSTSSSDRLFFSSVTTPLRENRYDTEPGSAMLPPLRVIATRTSPAARLRLSLRHSMRTATPLGP
ncbi:Uncharacterised protein [Mycobacteroides abscessus subsp. abscessus]|nr:Uncharacterised protein [Mycobacteroides abscessus subsp. abscessus]